MRKTLMLLIIILTLNLISVFADLRPPPARSPQPEPVKEEKPQGFCFAPTIIAGTLLSLSAFTAGMRLMRYRRHQLEVKASVI